MTLQPEAKSPHERQLIGLSTLLHLENQARNAKTAGELAFIMVNDTLRLLDYRQAVLCRNKTGEKIEIDAVSGVDKPGKNAPYVIWLRSFFKHVLTDKEIDGKKIQEISGEHLPGRLKKGWNEWGCSKGIWCPLISPGNDPDNEWLGSLWLIRETKWQESEKALLSQLTGAYAHAWQALLNRPARRQVRTNKIARRFLYVLAAVCVASSLALPVPLTVLAPARVVPEKPIIVTSPLKGVIKKIHVYPSQEVKAGQTLVSLDETELRNQFAVAGKTLEVARAEYKRALQTSLVHSENSLDAAILSARVDQKLAEQNYVEDELTRVTVCSPSSGIALFSDVNDWIGQPVATGEKIMTIADPLLTELEIHVPVDNAVSMDAGTRVRLFLNTDPSIQIIGKIEQTSYEAELSPEGIPGFPVRASVSDGREKLRIGQQGTAKIYGKKVRLYYYLFRRPWATIRRVLGM